MATWANLATESMAEAKCLHDAGFYRAAVSRCYYVAYAAMTGLFAPDRHMEFAHARNNPSHDQLQAYVDNNLPARTFGRRQRQMISRSFDNLRKARILADYVPGRTINRTDSLDSIRFASAALEASETGK